MCSLECKIRYLKGIIRKKDEDLLDNRIDGREVIRINLSGFLLIIVVLGNENKFYYKEYLFIVELLMSKVDGIWMNLKIKVKGDDINKLIFEF